MAQAGRLEQPVPRIVMIDDEVSNLQIVKIILMREDLNSELVLFDNGPEALEYMRSNPVELVLLDLAMPNMDGFQVMTHLKERPETAEIPVIFLSAFQETEYILKAFEMGATDFIGKPIISPILTARIQQTLQTRSLQKELKNSYEELVNTSRLKDELLSICSHDLRSPLSAIDLICQFLTDQDGDESRQSQPELVNRIVSQTRLARRLVENLLGLNRIEEGRLAPTLALFPAAELVRSCLEDEKPTMVAKKLAYHLSAPPEDLLCFGDRELIAQVFHNLLNNAAKFARSKISIGCELKEFSEDAGGRLVVSITDDGPGIPASHQEIVFRKYEKLHDKGSGSGLGLYISKQLVELHHGQIRLNAKHRKGAEFIVELPNAIKIGQLPDLSENYKSRILIASPSKSTARLLESVLVEGGMIDIVTANDMASLEAALRGATPEVAVIDLDFDETTRQLPFADDAAKTAVKWIFYGSPEVAEPIAMDISDSCRHMPLPLNPLIYLRHLSDFLQVSGTPSSVSSV